MKSLIAIFSTFIIVTLSLVSCYNDDIDSLQEQIDELKSYDVASVSSQIEEIETSVAQLQSLSSNLESYISTLQSQASSLESAVTAAEREIAQLEKSLSELQEDLEDALSDTSAAIKKQLAIEKAAVIAEIEALQASMETEIASINSTIESLQAKDELIAERITSLTSLADELKEYIDSSVDDVKDWAAATFLTLEAYYETVDELAALKTEASSISSSLDSISTVVREAIDAQLDTTLSDLVYAYSNEAVDSLLTQQVQEAYTSVTQAWETALEEATDAITAAYEADIASTVAALESSIQSWVTEQLSGYYTIALADAQLDSLQTILEKELSYQETYLETLISELDDSLSTVSSAYDSLITVLQSNLDAVKEYISSVSDDVTALKDSLDAVKSRIESDYTDAINEAITEFEGTISEKVDSVNQVVDEAIGTLVDDIAELSEKVDSYEAQIDEFKASVETYAESIDEMESLVSGILDQVQSITYIPSSTDDYAEMSYTYSYYSTYSKIVPVCTFDFLVRPASAAETIAENYSTVLSANSVSTFTRTPTLTDLTIASASASDGVLSVTVFGFNMGDSFFEYGGTAAISIVFSDDYSSYATDYIPVVAVNELDGIAFVDLGLSGVIWAACNVGAESPEDYGWYFCWGKTYDAVSASTYTYYTSTSSTLIGTSYDAVYKNYGSPWKLASQTQITNLCNLTWSWTSLNGVVGGQATGSNGNTLFLPASGNYTSGGVATGQGTYAYTWYGRKQYSSTQAYRMRVYNGTATYTTYAAKNFPIPARGIAAVSRKTTN